MFIVVFKAKDALNCEQVYYGPFPNFDEAYDFLCTLPSAANYEHKFVQELTK